MANKFARTAIRDNHQLEHLFSTAQNVAFPIFCFSRYTQLSSGPHYCYGDLISNFVNLRGLGGVLDMDWFKFSDEDKAEACAWLKEYWWHELGTLEVILSRHRSWRRRMVPDFILLGTDGMMPGGRKCTQARCFMKR
jgi:hypothetical protein